MAVYHPEVRVKGMVGGGRYNPKGNVKMKKKYANIYLVDYHC